MLFYGITAILWIGWMVLGWFMPDWVSLKGKDVWFVRILFWLIGTAFAGFAIYWKLMADRRKKALALAGEQGAELEFVLAEADKKLQASGKSLATMPVVFVMGARGSAKTTLITRSGVEPELLAGLVYQEGNQLVQTRTANVWLAKQTVFVEAAPTLLESDKLWNAFAQRFAPTGMTALKANAAPAPRSVLMFVGMEEFFQQNAGEAMAAKARILNQRLIEMSKMLGARIPVYVMFTKADQMPHFPPYVAYMSNEEATQILGATVPIADMASQGVYAETAAKKFSDLLEELFRSLAERRVSLQERDANQQGRPPVYEFPREFRKLKQAATTFLVDLCRPSQLAVSPFVRGFYFTGVRPVLTTDAAGTQRRVPQWLFVTRFFSEVLLKDRAALGAASSSMKTNTTRRLLLGVAGALGVIATTLFTVSYFNNRSLENELGEASKALRGVQVAPGEVPSLDSLTKLDRLRAVLERLRSYQRDGAPMMMRFGLYTGDTILPTSRKLYFESFRNVMFGETQTAVLDSMKRLPAAPTPQDDYMTTYNALKAYLITTSNPDKSTKSFLTPVLLKYWQGAKQVEPQRYGLIGKQFDFYAEELKESNPFSRENDTNTIDRTRSFLKQFSGEERLYNAILAEANRANPPINYNKLYPDGYKAVRVDKEVQGSFSKEGFAWMQDAFKNLPKYFGGEAWVLGEEVKISVNLSELEQRLRARYNKDFAEQWKAYLKSVTVLRYASLKDAADKLKMHSSNQSPLLAAIYLASKNTAVSEKTIADLFQPTQLLVAPGSAGQLIGGENQPYMGGLLQLQGSIEQISTMPASQAAQDPAAAQSLNLATTAKMTARNVAQKFRPDPLEKIDGQVLKLMEDPITYVETFLRGLGPAELNGAGAGFCKAFSDLISKYPFNPAAKNQATIAEFNSIFAPQTGSLWSFYETKLKAMLVHQGGEYRAVPTPSMALTPQFVASFNRFAAVTATAYGMNPSPSFRYSVKLNPEMKREVKLSIDGQSGEFKDASSPAKAFVWNGQGAGVRTTIVGGGTVSFDGPLGVFQWFNDAERWNQNTATSHTVLWYQRSGTKIMTDDQGKPLSMILDLEMPIPLFRKGYLAGLQCTSNVARSGN
ncbi:ImcF-related family protein [Bryobacter aggregatus]|uniref:ImcF-related family protein n=1 Tax=Bryobacter aggregatus TaxID=360054 RepID=UPI0004E0B8D0|nr:ImcF-related family protein [Bryobacter aggregatus]